MNKKDMSVLIILLLAPAILAYDWQIMNNGMPIDAGEHISTDGYALYKEQTIDENHNFVYFFDSEMLGKCMGRFNSEKRQWQIWSFQGWSSHPYLVAEPITYGHYVNDKMVLFNDPLYPGRFIGTSGSTMKSGLNKLDIHGSVYGLIFDMTDWLRYDNGIRYSKYTSTPVISSWGGASRDAYDFDFNGNIGIALGVYGHWGIKGRLMAALYHHQGNESLWQRWNNGKWNPITSFSNIPSDCSSVPDPEQPKYMEYYSPKVAYIQNSTEFLAVFNEIADNSIYSIKYNIEESLWYWWNGSSWMTGDDFDLRPVIDTDHSGRYKSLLSKKNGDVYLVYSKDYDYLAYHKVYYCIYNSSDSTWGSPRYLADASDYIVGLDHQDNLWFFYSDDFKIRLIKETENIMEEPEEIYQSRNSKLVSLGFKSGIPILLFSKDKRLFALSDADNDHWQGENQLILENKPPVHDIDKSKIEYLGKWDNDHDYERFSMPYGASPSGHMCIDSAGSIYSPRTPVCNVVIFHNSSINKTGWGGFWDYFSFPGGCAVDNAKGKVYITNYLVRGGGGMPTRNGRIEIFDKSRKTVDTYYRSSNLDFNKTYHPESSGNLHWPSDVAIDEESHLLYVSNSMGNEILKYDISQSPLRIGRIEDDFSFPQGIDTDQEGNLYVVDSYNSKIKKYDVNNNKIDEWGEPGRGAGQFIYPFSIDVENGRVYVTDPYNKRIQVFTKQGNYLYQWGEWNESLDFDDYIGSVVVSGDAVYMSAGDKIHLFRINNISEVPDYCTDLDRDGYFSDCGQADCDDHNAHVFPSNREVCDGFDNDCNGLIDENLYSTLGCSQEGICHGSHRTCADGAFGECHPAPRQEICNNVDEDCDGNTWFHLADGCDGADAFCLPDGELICLQPMDSCPNGLNSECDDFNDCTEDRCVNYSCFFTHIADIEDCYYCATGPYGDDMSIWGGLDVDHTGAVDNSDARGYFLQFYSTLTCNSSNRYCFYRDINRDGIVDSYDYFALAGKSVSCKVEEWRGCELGYVSEEICDGFDNDCDGLIDEGSCSLVPCSEGSVLPCGTAVGECKTGIRICSVDGWSGCREEIKPIPESCGDGLDSDCDGLEDQLEAMCTPPDSVFTDWLSNQERLGILVKYLLKNDL